MDLVWAGWDTRLNSDEDKNGCDGSPKHQGLDTKKVSTQLIMAVEQQELERGEGSARGATVVHLVSKQSQPAERHGALGAVCHEPKRL